MTPEQFQTQATAWLNAIGAVLPQAGVVSIVAVGVLAGIWASIKSHFQQKQIDSNTGRLDAHDALISTPPPTTTVINNQPTVIATDPEATEPGTPPTVPVGPKL